MRAWLRRVLVAAAVTVLVAMVLVWSLLPSGLAPPPRSDRIIAGVTVLNPGVERLLDRSIVIRDGRIVEVRRRRAGDPEPLCPGCFALPGLIDAHVHTPPRLAPGNQELFALLYLAHGVTSVRDVGASDGSIGAFATRVNQGDVLGPHMYRCGPVLDGDPPGWPMATVVNGAERGAAIVDALAADGVDCIKVYNEMGPEGFAAIAAAAKRHGLPLVGHVPHAVGLDRVSDFESQHFTGIPYRTRPRPPLGWDIRDEDVLALDDEEIDAALAVARERRISLTPTLANFRLRLTASDPARFPPTAGAALLPTFWADAWQVLAGHPSTPEAIDRRLRALPRLHQMLAMAHRRGIEILAGTDTLMPWLVPGESLLLEIDELEAALGSAEAALASATTVNGRHIAAGQIGAIAAGTRADLLLLPNDPAERLSALREWRFLVADGRLFARIEIDAWVEDYRRHFRGEWYSGVMGTVVGFLVDRFGHTNTEGESSAAAG